MIQETKIYSDFIKRNKIKVTHYGFIFKGEEVRVYQSDEGKGWWYAGENGDNCHTKKAAIYYHIVNNCKVENGIII